MIDGNLLKEVGRGEKKSTHKLGLLLRRPWTTQDAATGRYHVMVTSEVL